VHIIYQLKVKIMKRNFLQDVIPPNQKRSIRNIPISRRRSELSDHRDNGINDNDVHPRMNDIKSSNSIPPEPIKNSNDYFEEYDQENSWGFKKWVIGIILILVAFPLLYVFVFRQKAEIVVEPKTETAYASANFEISKNNVEKGDSYIDFKVSKIEKQSSSVVKASGEQDVSEKATGKIKVYNEFSSTPQNLVKNTRFESKDGLIYRINNSISIPGYKEENGKIIPGELEVEIFADAPGVEYNSGVSDFTIPGFKDFPDRYKKVYAKGITEMSGGYVGKKRVISDSDKVEALEKIKADLKEQIVSDIKKSGENFIVSFDESKINYSKISEENSGEDVKINVTSSVDVYIFDLVEFSTFMHTKLIPSSDVNSVVITNPGEIKTKISDLEDSTSDSVKSLYVEGDLNFESVINTDALSVDLAGENRESGIEIMSKYNSIRKFELNLRPIWSKKFPKNPSKIDIIIKN
jgi:hypothetical protein